MSFLCDLVWSHFEEERHDTILPVRAKLNEITSSAGRWMRMLFNDLVDVRKPFHIYAVWYIICTLAFSSLTLKMSQRDNYK